MIKKLLFILCVVLMFSASACKSQPTWQEQYDLGIRYLSEGNYEEAIIAFTAAIEIDPQQALAYIGRADAYKYSGKEEWDFSKAEEDYQIAIELDETIVDAWIGLADLYFKNFNDIQRAVNTLEAYLEIDNSNMEVRYSLADLYIESGDSRRAVEVMEGCLEEDNSNVDTWIKLINIYINLKDFDRAEEILNSAIEAVGDNEKLNELYELIQSEKELISQSTPSTIIFDMESVENTEHTDATNYFNYSMVATVIAYDDEGQELWKYVSPQMRPLEKGMSEYGEIGRSDNAYYMLLGKAEKAGSDSYSYYESYEQIVALDLFTGELLWETGNFYTDIPVMAYDDYNCYFSGYAFDFLAVSKYNGQILSLIDRFDEDYSGHKSIELIDNKAEVTLISGPNDYIQYPPEEGYKFSIDLDTYDVTPLFDNYAGPLVEGSWDPLPVDPSSFEVSKVFGEWEISPIHSVIYNGFNTDNVGSRYYSGAGAYTDERQKYYNVLINNTGEDLINCGNINVDLSYDRNKFTYRDDNIFRGKYELNGNVITASAENEETGEKRTFKYTVMVAKDGTLYLLEEMNGYDIIWKSPSYLYNIGLRGIN